MRDAPKPKPFGMFQNLLRKLSRDTAKYTSCWILCSISPFKALQTGYLADITESGPYLIWATLRNCSKR